MPNPPGTLVTSSTLCSLAGITYRQCNYWTGRFLHPTAAVPLAAKPTTTWTPTPEHPGSGLARFYPVAEVSVAWVMRQLVQDIGLLRAALIARGYVEDGTAEHALADGVTLCLSLQIPDWDVPPLPA